MHNLIIDLETYSSTDISKSGVYRYAEDKDFEILLFGYSIDFNEAKVIDLKSGEKIPEEVIEAIKSEAVLKWAHNASFERICLSRYLGLPLHTYLDPSSWHCSMVYASMLGLPKALKDIGIVLELDKQKLDEGKDLIRYFSLPCKATKSNRMRTRNLPIHDISKWALFKEYNKRDVDSEVEIIKRLSAINVPDFIWREYSESEMINDRGVLIDKYLVSNAIDIAAKTNENLLNSMQNITNLANPNSVTQLKKWLIEQGLEVEDLGKKNVEGLIKSTTNNLISSALALRLQTSKSSIKKYEAMEKCKLSDQRIRGMFQFYGASRTGRFASKFVQLQNLRQNHLTEDEVKSKFIKAYNQVMVNKEQVINDANEVIKALTDTSLIDNAISETESELEVISELVRKLVRENASHSQNQDDYTKKYKELEARYEKTKSKLDELNDEKQIRKGKLLELNSYLVAFKEAWETITDWDDNLWMTVLDKAVVNRDGTITFKFIVGIDITI